MSAPRTLTGGRAAHCENCSSRSCCITISQVLRVMVLDPRPLEWRFVLSRIHVTFDSVLAGTMGRVRKIEEAATLSTSRKSSTSRKIKSTSSARASWFAARGRSWVSSILEDEASDAVCTSQYSTVHNIMDTTCLSVSLQQRLWTFNLPAVYTGRLVFMAIQYASKLRYPL